MLNMKNFAFYKTRKITIAILFALLICCSAFFGVATAHAENSQPITPPAQTQLFLPSTDLEYKSLTSPIDVYSDDNVTAIVQNDQKLIIYKDGLHLGTLESFTAIKQVKKSSDQHLLISDNGIIYSINLNDITKKTALTSTDGNGIGGNYFDINANYLVTAYSGKATIYQRTANGYEQRNETFNLNADYPVAINEENTIFYVDDKIYAMPADNLSAKNAIASVIPSKMIANANALYFIYNKDILMCDFKNENPSTTLLSVDSENNYDLGKLKTPTGISFRNGNLIISDSELNAVQEFKVENNNLSFTGFAIASGKTAYNRISTLATDIEKQGETVATLDNNKLLIYSKINADKYAKGNYMAFFAKDFNGENLPDAFSLGNGTVLLSFEHNQSTGKLSLLDLVDGESEHKDIFVGNIIRDICYQSGVYYVLASNGAKTLVYDFGENDFSFSEPKIETSTLSATQITVDVFGNIYLADDNNVYKYSINATNGKYEMATTLPISGVKKLETDLGGKVYALTSNGLNVYDGTSFDAIDIKPYNNEDKIKSFAINFDKKEVLILYEGKEYVCYTNQLDNFALSEATVSDETYKTTDNNASIENLKVATVKSGNVYSVTRNSQSKFDYKGLVEKENEYAYICDVDMGNDLILCALAGQNGVVLVNKNELEISNVTTQSAPTTAYVTTDVNAYYLPIITKNADYVLTDNGGIRIDKSTKITPMSKIQILDKEFYFASVTLNERTYNGYIPVDFTVEVLSEDVKWDEYTIEKVLSTSYYLDQTMQQKSGTLKDGEKVKVLSIENGVAKIIIDGQDGVFYIKSSAIKDEPNVAVRNILIILAVAASVCGTASYFILRKKD